MIPNRWMSPAILGFRTGYLASSLFFPVHHARLHRSQFPVIVASTSSASVCAVERSRLSSDASYLYTVVSYCCYPRVNTRSLSLSLCVHTRAVVRLIPRSTSHHSHRPSAIYLSPLTPSCLSPSSHPSPSSPLSLSSTILLPSYFSPPQWLNPCNAQHVIGSCRLGWIVARVDEMSHSEGCMPGGVGKFEE